MWAIAAGQASGQPNGESPGDCDVLRGLVNAKILSKDANGALKDAHKAVLSPVVVLRFVHETN